MLNNIPHGYPHVNYETGLQTKWTSGGVERDIALFPTDIPNSRAVMLRKGGVVTKFVLSPTAARALMTMLMESFYSKREPFIVCPGYDVDW